MRFLKFPGQILMKHSFRTSPVLKNESGNCTCNKYIGSGLKIITIPSSNLFTKFYPHIQVAIIILLIMVPRIAFSQKERINHFFIEGKVHNGFILPHEKEIEYMVEKHVKAIEINAGIITNGKNPWEKYYKLPSYGIGLFHGGLGNKKVFGNATAIFPFFNGPIIRGKKIFLNYHVGFGLSYLGKTFHIENNPMNLAIGSHVNIYFNALLDFELILSQRVKWVNGLGFIHFSNGRMKAPNLGLNLVSFSSGINYNFIKSNEKLTREKKKRINYNDHNFIFMVSSGSKSRNHFDLSRYFISSFSPGYRKKIVDWYYAGLGFDIFYDSSIKTELRGLKDFSTNDLFKVGLHFSNNFNYDDITISLQVGYYLLYSYEDISNIYTRLALQYAISNNWFTNISLKAHRITADFIEWGIGYKL